MPNGESHTFFSNLNKRVAFLITLLLISPFIFSQRFVTRSIKDFGAKGDGHTNDQQAFEKASDFFNKRNGNGKLIIPKGIYIAGKQLFIGNIAGSTSMYSAGTVLKMQGCTNMEIEGQSGAIIRNPDSMRIGTFSPKTGKPLRDSIKNLAMQAEYGKYAANVTNVIVIAECVGIKVSGLGLDGNVGNFIFGGNWGIGKKAYELIHYAVYVVDSKNVTVKNCNIRNFACDGIYISNTGEEIKTRNITIDRCTVNFCGRNGLSWIGGENIKVINSVFSNQGRGMVQESPGAGISIEAENNSSCRDGFFFNCVMENNAGSAITSGSSKLSSRVKFKKCKAASPDYYTLFVDASSHEFEDCRFYGTVLIWYRAASKSDAVKFRQCSFEENYCNKKMYDGTYLVGAEATGTSFENCSFRSYTTASYYLNGLTKNCDPENFELLNVSGCRFYNFSTSGSALGKGIAGMAGHAVFYDNRFYANKGFRFQNGFELPCHTDYGKNIFADVSSIAPGSK